ncbi:MAG: hypothetical protein WBH03_17970 [Cyclobacteriaceae bacterium]
MFASVLIFLFSAFNWQKLFYYTAWEGLHETQHFKEKKLSIQSSRLSMTNIYFFINMNQIVKGVIKISIALSLFVLSDKCFGYEQVDTVYIKFSESDLTHHYEVGKHPQDPHNEGFYPFTGLHGYKFSLSKETLAKAVYFIFASHGPENTGAPFYYEKLSVDRLEQIYWLTGESLSKWPFLNMIQYFNDKNKVIMLYDATQPPGDEQYVVRVYFDFNGYE